MVRYHGNEVVNRGLYWNSGKWEITTVEKEGTRLPGGEDVKYHRIPVALVLILGPVLGAAYVMFLPLIGFGLFFAFIGKKAVPFLTRANASIVNWLTAMAREER